MCFVLLQLGIEPRILFTEVNPSATELYPHPTRSVLQDEVMVVAAMVVMIRNSGGLTVLKGIRVLTVKILHFTGEKHN